MDYGRATVGGTTAATLAFTGSNVLWTLITAVALIAVGGSAIRMLPKRQIKGDEADASAGSSEAPDLDVHGRVHDAYVGHVVGAGHQPAESVRAYPTSGIVQRGLFCRALSRSSTSVLRVVPSSTVPP